MFLFGSARIELNAGSGFKSIRKHNPERDVF
jgi:hypothetical protein